MKYNIPVLCNIRTISGIVPPVGNYIVAGTHAGSITWNELA